MTANAQLTNVVGSEYTKAKDADILKNVTESIKKEFVNANIKEENCDDFTKDYNRILSITVMSIKMAANSYSKNSEFIETSEIERIKNLLNDYAHNSKKVEDFKKEIIEDLTDFQKKIKINHIQKIVDLTKQKQSLEKEIHALNEEKQKLAKGKIFRALWTDNTQEKAYECRISSIQAKIQHLSQKISELDKTKPIATEKDILMYNLHIKEKYVRIKPQMLWDDAA